MWRAARQIRTPGRTAAGRGGPAPGTGGRGMRVRIQHTSMQFSDTTAHKKADAHRIFARAAQEKVAWCTGTEAGQQASSDLRVALAKEAKAAGYKFTVIADLWIAVRKDLITKG